MQFWILILTIAIMGGVVTFYAVRERERELAFGAMCIMISCAALIIVALIFLR